MKANTLVLALTLSAAAVPAWAVEWNTPEARARWAELSEIVYGGDARITKTDRVVSLDAPSTAQDAALVPVAINIAPGTPVKELSLIIDQNPGPVAATVRFGPAGDPRQMKFRVRVDGFTNMHAVVASEDGTLVQNAVFVKGAGGCSAPVGMSEAEAFAAMGDMKLKFGTNAALDDAPQATLMIRHPNFNGMQMDKTTHAYTPARFIKSIAVTRGDDTVFAMTSDISLSTNPVVAFLYKPGSDKPFDVTVVDSVDGRWTQRFDAPQTMN